MQPGIELSRAHAAEGHLTCDGYGCALGRDVARCGKARRDVPLIPGIMRDMFTHDQAHVRRWNRADGEDGDDSQSAEKETSATDDRECRCCWPSDALGRGVFEWDGNVRHSVVLDDAERYRRSRGTAGQRMRKVLRYRSY